MAIDVLERGDLPFPHSLPEFQRLFPDEAACAAYLERARWSDGFNCDLCGSPSEPYRFANRPGVLRCRRCNRDTSLTAGTVMERTHIPLSVWFWAAYLVASQTPGMSAVQFQRQLGLSRYETAFQILHKLRAGMVRPDQDRIGGKPEEHVEADETYVGGRTRGRGRGVHDMVLVAGAVEVRQRQRTGSLNKRKTGRYAGRVRLAVVQDRSARSLGGFIERAVTPGATITADDWSGYAKLGERGYCHTAVAERGDMQVAETFLPITHLVFSNLKKPGCAVSITASARNTCRPISTNSPSASTAASIPSTPLVPCSESPATLPRRPIPSSMPRKRNPLHLVGLGANRISTVCCTERRDVGLAVQQRSRGRFHFGHLRRRQHLDPVAARRHLGAEPDARRVPPDFKLV